MESIVGGEGEEWMDGGWMVESIGRWIGLALGDGVMGDGDVEFLPAKSKSRFLF